MSYSSAQASRDFAIRQGAMRSLYSEGTGSNFDEGQSAPFQGVPRLWPLLSSATPYAAESHSATTGVCVVIIKYESDHAEEVSAAMVFNRAVALPSIAYPATFVMNPAYVLDKVRTIFGLNISETAEVFRITRQTAYQWMKLDDLEQVRAHDNRERLKQIYGAARAWERNHPPLKGRWLYALLPAGNTVLDLLKAATIDLDALQAAYQTLAASAMERRREEGECATQAVKSLASAFAGLGAGRKARKG